MSGQILLLVWVMITSFECPCCPPLVNLTLQFNLIFQRKCFCFHFYSTHSKMQMDGHSVPSFTPHKINDTFIKNFGQATSFYSSFLTQFYLYVCISFFDFFQTICYGNSEFSYRFHYRSLNDYFHFSFTLFIAMATRLNMATQGCGSSLARRPGWTWQAQRWPN